MNRTTVMIDWKKPLTIGLRKPCCANAARTSRSSATSASTSGASPSAPKRSTAASSRRGMPGEVERSLEEARHGDFVGGDQRGGRARPPAAGLTGDAQGRETDLVGRPEIETARGDQVGRSGRRRPAVGIGQRVLDRKSHVGVPSWAFREPSTKRTAEWTTLCGWMTTSIAS